MAAFHEGRFVIVDGAARHQFLQYGGRRAMAAMDGLEIFTDVIGTANKRVAYQSYLRRLDNELSDHGDLAIVVMDGDPRNPDPGTREEHRGLSLGSRAIIEDGWVQNSAASQFIQMADIVAHCAFQHAVRNDDRSFMWGW